MTNTPPPPPTEAMCQAGSKIRIDGNFGALYLFHAESADIWTAMLHSASADPAYALALAQWLVKGMEPIAWTPPWVYPEKDGTWPIEPKHGQRVLVTVHSDITADPHVTFSMCIKEFDWCTVEFSNGFGPYRKAYAWAPMPEPGMRKAADGEFLPIGAAQSKSKEGEG